MFEKKQIIYSETQGVCQVDNIVSLKRGITSIPYYVLKSVFDRTKVSYIPVEHHQVMLRELFSMEEAKALLADEKAMENEQLRAAVKYVLKMEEE